MAGMAPKFPSRLVQLNPLAVIAKSKVSLIAARMSLVTKACCNFWLIVIR
jgi:hypothetical protein